MRSCNYRPISVNPFFGKISEIILNQDEPNSPTRKKVLHPRPCRFKARKKTTDTITTLVTNIVGDFDKGYCTTLIMCNLRRTFHCVSGERHIFNFELKNIFQSSTIYKIINKTILGGECNIWRSSKVCPGTSFSTCMSMICTNTILRNMFWMMMTQF